MAQPAIHSVNPNILYEYLKKINSKHFLICFELYVQYILNVYSALWCVIQRGVRLCLVLRRVESDSVLCCIQSGVRLCAVLYT